MHPYRFFKITEANHITGVHIESCRDGDLRGVATRILLGEPHLPVLEVWDGPTMLLRLTRRELSLP